ncbi:MAG: cysteine desulfurase family protein [Candidatus Magasanikbacteria bacterium]
MNNSKKIYLDYAASTPVGEEVFKVMKPYFSEEFGNPGSLHKFGQEAMKVLDESREKASGLLGLDFENIIFTGSATEANNLVLRGIAKKINNNPEINFENPKIIVSEIEHECVLETAHDLESDGFDVAEIDVNPDGRVKLNQLEKELTEDTVIISIMYANNEIGTIQPISKISEIVQEFKKEKTNTQYPLIHSDAVQAFQFLECQPKELGLDLMTLSAHKIYGPKGVGLLANITEESLSPIITGGGQEFGLRSGTENVPLIKGLSKALEIAKEKRAEERKRMKKLSRELISGLKQIKSDIKLNGVSSQERFSSDKLKTIPNICNFYFPNNSAEELLMQLDLEGVAVSTGSACSARSAEASHVLEGLGHNPQRVNSSLRLSLGKYTTQQEIKKTISVFEKIME